MALWELYVNGPQCHKATSVGVREVAHDDQPASQLELALCIDIGTTYVLVKN